MPIFLPLLLFVSLFCLHTNIRARSSPSQLPSPLSLDPPSSLFSYSLYRTAHMGGSVRVAYAKLIRTELFITITEISTNSIRIILNAVRICQPATGRPVLRILKKKKCFPYGTSQCNKLKRKSKKECLKKSKTLHILKNLQEMLRDYQLRSI